jgi:hypothetical protein
VDLTTVHFTDFHPNSNGIGLDGNALDDALDASLAAFTADIKAAVPSYLGLQLTIGQSGHPVTLTRITPHRTARTSLRVPLTDLGPRFDPDSRVILYAATAGAFVDLAADLSYALHLRTSSDRSTDPAGSSDGDGRRHRQVDSDRRLTLDADVPRLTLDADVPLSPLASGMSGLSELSTINRAIGVLIGHGHHPDHAGDTLRCDATSQGLKLHSYAARLLGRDQPDRDTGPTRSGGDGLPVRSTPGMSTAARAGTGFGVSARSCRLRSFSSQTRWVNA